MTEAERIVEGLTEDDDPHDEWPWARFHRPGVALGEKASGLLMQAVREYFEETGHA